VSLSLSDFDTLFVSVRFRRLKRKSHYIVPGRAGFDLPHYTGKERMLRNRTVAFFQVRPRQKSPTELGRGASRQVTRDTVRLVLPLPEQEWRPSPLSGRVSIGRPTAIPLWRSAAPETA